MPTIAFDTETTGLRRRESAIFAFSTCSYDGVTAVNRLDGSLTRQAQSNLTLKRLWADPRNEFTVHNLKFDLGFVQRKLNVDPKSVINRCHCTMLMSHILQNDHPSHALDDLGWELAGYPKDDDKAIKPYTKGGGNYQLVPESLMDQYQRNDSERGMLLHRFFYPKITANKDWLECYRNEVEVIVPTLAMEDRGVMLHRQKCYELIAKLQKDADLTLDQIEHVTGERLKPGSEAFRSYLYHTLKLPVLKRTSGTRAPSVEKEVLQELFRQTKLPILDLAIRYKSWQRGCSVLSGYLDAATQDDILHPNIRTCAAITGRESCTDPNLMAVEKHEGVVLNPYPVPARTVFRPRPGHVNFHLDYSGQESRLLIHYSGDKVLVDICNDPKDGDTHSYVANLFYPGFKNLTDKLERKTKRNASKNGFFGKSYGASPIKLAETLGISTEEGFRAAKRFELALPKLSNLIRELSLDIRRLGYIETAFGRRLHVPRDMAYMGVNYLIQGTGAEMLKRGQVRVHKYLQEATCGEVGLLLPIHDELIIEFPRKRLSEAKAILRHVAFLMTDFPGRFRVPAMVEVDVATYDWAHKTEFPLN